MNTRVGRLPQALFCVSLLCVLVAFFFGVEVAYRLSVLLSVFVLFLFAFVCKGGSVAFRQPLILLFSCVVFLGVVLGLLNVFFRDNSIKEFFIYSGIYCGQLVALVLGYSYVYRLAGDGCSSVVDEVHVFKWLAWLCLFDVLWVLVRVFVVGLDVRTSYGFSYLLPFLIVYVARFKSLGLLFSSVWVYVSSSFFLAYGLLSGLRSVSAMAVLLLFLTFAFSGVRRFFVGVLVSLILVASVGFFFVNGAFDGQQATRRVETSVGIIVNRFKLTLFNDGGAKLDPNGGRADESMYALGDFFGREYVVFDMLVGRGYGFVFSDHSKDGELSAHVHVTPVAFS